MRVCLGGTFDIIHEGHKRLLSEAFSLGDGVLIGLTSDGFAQRKRANVSPYSERKRKLDAHLKRKGFRNYEIVKIDNTHGPAAILKELRVIVVSEGTAFRAKRINRTREKRNLRQLKVVEVPIVLAEDDTPISSRRIREGEIDRKGRLLRPIVVCIGSENRNKVEAVKKQFSAIFKKVEFRSKKVRTSVPPQPFGHDTVKGAIERAKNAIKKGGDFGVGIEAGLYWNPRAGRYFDVQFCAVVDKTGKVTIGHGSGFCYPRSVVEKVKKGATVSKAMESLVGIKDIGEKKGAIGYLSKGMLKRKELTEQAVFMALVPRMRKELYFQGKLDSQGK
jgi:inosine/xanthosine triphosphatase